MGRAPRPAPREPALPAPPPLLALLLAWASSALAAADPPPAQPWRGVRVVANCHLQGIGADDHPLAVVSELWRADERLGGHLAELSVVHGAAFQGPWTLVAADRRAATVVAALRAGQVRCGSAAERPAVRTRTELLVMAQDGQSSLLDALEERGLDRTRASWWDCTGPGERGLVLVGPADALPPSWELGDWELGRALMGRWAEQEPSRRFLVATRPVAEPSRLVRQARRLLAEEGTVHVDAGSFLDGVSSARNDRFSLLRPLTWSMLESLAPAALVPGETELALGADAFQAELLDHPLPYLATNWQAPAALELPDHRIVAVEGAGGRVRLAFLGVLDPVLQTWVPGLGEAGVTLTDPVSSVQAVVDRLYAASEPPDVVVVLSTAGPQVHAALRRHLRGVDLVVGDPSLVGGRLDQAEWALRPQPPGEEGAPVGVGLDGLATVDLRLGAAGLVAVQARPVEVVPGLPVEPQITSAITSVRAEVYPPLDVPLVPAAQPDAPALAWTEAQWRLLVCEALRRATSADVVLLRELPAPSHVPGPLSELMAVEYLSMLDHLELHRVPGSKLKTVLDRSWGNVPVACGAQPGSDSPVLRGRSLESGRAYRLVTTDRTRATTALGQILEGVPASGPLDPRGVRTVLGPLGPPWTVRAATLAALREVREAAADPDEAVRGLLTAAASDKPPQWAVRLRGLSLSASRFQGADQGAFASIPETLATSPTSFTLSTAADLALERDELALFWDLRYRQSYASLATAGSEVQESADDWRLSTSVELPSLSRRVLLTWKPYSELAFDSEHTPTTDELGLANPRQADLSLAVGAAAGATGPLSSLRLGAFASRDLARLLDKPTEWGGKAEVGTSTSLGWTTWTVTGEGSVYADTSVDDESDLRFKLLGTTKLAAPLARWLAVSLSAQGFLLQGRVPQTAVVDGSWQVGAALDASGVWAL